MFDVTIVLFLKIHNYLQKCEREREKRRIEESKQEHIPSFWECPFNPEKGIRSLRARQEVVS